MQLRIVTLRRWFGSIDPERIDWVAAGLLLIAFELQIWTGTLRSGRPVAAVAAVVPCAAVAVRRRWLIEVLALGLITSTAKLVAGGPQPAGGGVGVICVMLIFYAVGAFYSGRRAWVALVLGIVVTTIANVNASGSALANLVFGLGIAVTPAFLLGRIARDHAARERAGRARAERLDSERELNVGTAALTERTRLAREIHDVIAHSVSVMVIQAAGARTVMVADQDRAEEALKSVERAGREALAELRRLLGVLGDGRSLRELAPQPGLDDVEELVARTNSSEVTASLMVEGRPVAISPGLSLCAYRVVQEALTNAIKPRGSRPRAGLGALGRRCSRARSRRRRLRRPTRLAEDERWPRNCRHVRAGRAARRQSRGRPGRRPGLRRPRVDSATDAGGLMTAARDRPRRIDLRSVDALAAVLVSLDLVLESTLENGIPHRLATAVAGLMLGALVAVRRSRPGTAVIACSLVALAQEPFHGQLFSLDSSVVLLPFALCAYGAGAWLPWRTGISTVATATALLIANMAIETYVTEPSTSGGFGTGIVLSLILFGVPWLVGRFIAERGRRADAFTLLARQTEAEQAQRARAAIEQERMRIGRDLQDIIAHSVSVMVVQAGGARRLLRTEPERARESILNVERTGRETLAEMRRLLGLLRADQDPRALSPQPGLDQLDELIHAVRQAGLACKVDTEGDPVALTPGIDLVGYRVIEAALSHAAEARCSQAWARIRYTRGWLEFEVDGDRPALGARAGLASVTERVDLYGGRLTVEPDGPFALRCRLPLEAVGVS